MNSNGTPFQKRVLIPFWTLRLGLMLLLIGIYAWAIAAVTTLSDDDIDNSTGEEWTDGTLDRAKGAAIGVIAALLGLLLLCALLDIIAIIMFARSRLRPKVFLIFNVLQTLFWLIMLVLSAIGTATSANAGIIVNIIIFLLYLGLLIYASVIYHRDRKGSFGARYQQAPNPGMHAPRSHDFENQPYNPELIYQQDQPARGYATEYYSGVPQPQTYYGQAGGPHVQHDYGYGGQQKSVPQEGAYELADHSRYR